MNHLRTLYRVCVLPPVLLCACIGLFSCSGPKPLGKMNEPMKKHDAFLQDLLQKQASRLEPVLNNPEKYRLQIIYTQIDRKRNNSPRFTHYFYNVDPDVYFYPASTVKFPIAALSLQKINRLRRAGIDRNSTMITQAEHAWQEEVLNDPTSPDCRPTVAHYIKRLLLVSDNDASNRLYEFLGQDYLNRQLQKKGYEGSQVVHRLAMNLDVRQHRVSNPVSFYSDSGKNLYAQPGEIATFEPELKTELIGKAFMSGGQLVERPFDFSVKNRMPLEHLHHMLQSVMFPRSVSRRARFKLKKDDYRFLHRYMSQFPRETDFPSYNQSNFHDGYAKFLLQGSEKGQLPAGIRIFNKVGVAYGFLTDMAYIVDFDKQVEFMVSATLYCNENEILNDNRYDYDTIGLPFMKNLGLMLYEHELDRPRKRAPDLSEFKIDYNSKD